MKTRADKILLAALSHLVADALGVPYEFNPPDRIPAQAEIEFTPPAGFHRSHTRAPAGAYSDDGATFLCLLASLFACGGLDLEDFGRRLVAWLDNGYLAHERVVFDVGNQTSASVAKLRAGAPAATTGGLGESTNGNGSLMRVLAVALWHTGTDQELVKLAMRSSLPTHAHPRSLVCCAVYALWVRYMLNGFEPLKRAGFPTPDRSDACFEEALRELHAPGMLEEQEQYVEARALWKLMLDERMNRHAPTGSGYVVDALLSAVRANRGKASYESVVRAAIAFGNDTDTTACIAGPIAAIRFGEIPARWLAASAASRLGPEAAEVIARLTAHASAEVAS